MWFSFRFGGIFVNVGNQYGKVMWSLYTQNNDVKNKTYVVWCFGGYDLIRNKELL